MTEHEKKLRKATDEALHGLHTSKIQLSPYDKIEVFCRATVQIARTLRPYPKTEEEYIEHCIE